MKVHAVVDRRDAISPSHQIAPRCALLLVARRSERNVMNDTGAELADWSVGLVQHVEDRRSLVVVPRDVIPETTIFVCQRLISHGADERLRSRLIRLGQGRAMKP